MTSTLSEAAVVTRRIRAMSAPRSPAQADATRLREIADADPSSGSYARNHDPGLVHRLAGRDADRRRGGARVRPRELLGGRAAPLRCARPRAAARARALLAGRDGAATR